MKKSKQISRKFLWSVFAVLALIFSFTVYASFGNLNAEKYSAKLERLGVAEKVKEKKDDKESVLPNYNDDRVLDYEPGVVNVKWKNAGQKGNLLAKAKTKFKDLQNKDIFPLNKKIEGKKSLLQNRLKFGLDRIQTVRSESIRDKVAKLEPDLKQIKKDYLKSISIKNGVNVNKKSKAIVKEFTLEDVPFFMTEDGKIQDELTLNLQKEFKDAEYAELNNYYHLTAPINEPYYPEMWSLQKESTKYPILDNNLDGDFDEEGENGQSAENAGISAEEGWANDTSNGGEGVIVAVIDTGLDINHEDIKDNVWVNADEIPDNGIDDDKNGYIDDVNGYNFSDSNNDISDYTGHGSHVSGTIAAEGNNGIGITGIAYSAKIMPVRVFSISSSSNAVVNAIYYAVNNGADVINMSLGAEGKSQTREDAIKFATESKVICVVGAGNDSDDAQYYNPANIKEAVTVGALNEKKGRASFSNYGMNLDISAPGTNILSLKAEGKDIYCVDNSSSCGKLVYKKKYFLMQGTSMATPHISGVAAIAKALYPDWSVEQITQLIRYAGEKDGVFNEEVGYGKINLKEITAFKDQFDKDMTQAIIQSPQNGEVLKGKIQIQGIANAGNSNNPYFSRWELLYKKFNSTEDWNYLVENNTQEKNGMLTEFNTSYLTDGEYYFQLRTYGNSDLYFAVDTIKVKIDNVYFTSPSPANFNIFGKEDISFEGEITAIGNVEYELSYQPESCNLNDESCWTTFVSKNIIGDKFSGQLGVWKYDPNLIRNNIYNIRLKTTVNNQIGYEYLNLTVDDYIKEGWPKKFLQNGQNPFSFAVDDFNKDNLKEIVTINDGLVYLYDNNGNTLQGWPFKWKPNNENIFYNYIPRQNPVLFDINNDGKKEIFVAVNYQEFIGSTLYDKTAILGIDINGQVLENFPLILDSYFDNYIFINQFLVVDDINNDKILDFFLCGNTPFYCIGIDSSGKKLSGWPKTFNAEQKNFYSNNPSIGDLNNDGYKDIVLPLPNGEIITYSGKDGAELWTNKIQSATFISSSTLADINGDKKIEILVIGNDNYIYIFDNRGNIIKSWQINDTESEEDYIYVSFNPSIGDIDNVNGPEIIINYTLLDSVNFVFHNRLKVFNNNGSLQIKKEISTYQTGLLFLSGSTDQAIITNIDGDNNPDFLISDNYSLFAFDRTGSLISNSSHKIIPYSFYKLMNNFFPQIIDIDGDNKTELVVAVSGISYHPSQKEYLVVYDLDAPVISGADHWPMFQHDAQHTSYYESPQEVNLIPPTISITSPKNGDILKGKTVNISADLVSRPQGQKVVEYYIDDEFIDSKLSSPYQITWDSTTVKDGEHKIKVIGKDRAGEASAEIKVYVANNAPIISITSPKNGDILKGKTVNISADLVSKQSAHKMVKFYVDGDDGLIDAKLSEPYQIIWNSTTVADGEHKIKVIGQDIAGEASAEIKIYVANNLSAISIISPKNNEVVKGTVPIKANLNSKQDGQKMVEFYVDEEFIDAKLSEPYQVNWDSTKIADGKHTIKVIGKDRAGENTAVTVIYVQNKVPQIKKSLKPISK